MLDEDKKFLPKVALPYSPTLFGVKMPIVNIKFEKLPQPVPALVDSGATNCLLHPSLASTIGLKLDDSEKRTGTGAGGAYDYIPSKPMEIMLLDNTFEVEFDVPEDINFAWPCILGQNFIFKFAKIVFKGYKQELEIFLRKDIN